MSNLAILGGKKVRDRLFPRYNNIGKEEKDAVARVMEKGVLSKYLGCWNEDFYGGEEILAFEKEWSEHFGCKYSISVNSNTSGLQVALGACGIGYGDEVIVSPYSMSASASAPVIWNATPVFADIDPNHYGISYKEFEKKITPRTKAIIIVHIFGCPADMDEILKIAKNRGIYVIEDAAQAPGATYKGQKVGLLGDVGVFSLNYHKHIHTGEGGVCTTNNEKLARKMQLIRNHAESVVEGMGEKELENMIGYNMRLTELQAAIGREQLKKLDKEVTVRQKYAQVYNDALREFGFIAVSDLSDRKSAYYMQAFQYDAGKTGVSREAFINAVKAELSPVAGRENEFVPIYVGYVRPLYLLPMFQNRTAHRKNFPFNEGVSYQKGICPVTEDMHYNKLWFHDLTRSPLTETDVNDVVAAYVKVCSNINDLK